MNPRRPLQRILRVHLPNQTSDVAVDLRTPTTRPRLPAPVGLKSSPVPANHRLRLDDYDCIQERRKDSGQTNEDQAIEIPQSHPRRPTAAQNDNLLTLENVLGFKSLPPIESRTQDQQEPSQECEHCRSHLTHAPPLVTPDEVYVVRSFWTSWRRI